ncbi:acyl-CoA dehydratase activase [Desulfosarcina sp.]|uniref:acyl-CoA dehydratase activase n=1 Tax=Desulfosarcina sp. TaxID=2027861 RepID=UPI003970F736
MYDPSTTDGRPGPQGAFKAIPAVPHHRQKTDAMGICLGASTISVVLISSEPGTTDRRGRPRVRIVKHGIYPHEGDPRRTLLAALSDFYPSDCDRLAVTGRQFRNSVNLSSLSEPEAVGYAYRHLKPEGIDCPAIVSAGGETFMAYILDAAGCISNVITGNKCASGTGEFFLQQLRRMNVSLEEASRWSETEAPYPVSGRCSVFCKSDCTHATNKGVPRSRVAAGLCRMMAHKILDLLKKIPKRHIMLIGGTSKNNMMVSYLGSHIDGLIVPEQAPYFEALGAAIWALDHSTQPFMGTQTLFSETAARFDRLQPLEDFREQVTFGTMARDTANDGDLCLLGLDVGSTTTKAVLIRQADDALLASVYLRTNGDPVAASRQCYAALLNHVRQSSDPTTVNIVGLGVCGSGRQIAGLHAQTDGVINEIIAHCTAAVHFDPDVDTLFEIGGQDAKYTHITAGVASDYAMNEACSAGTGSFLEESAQETLGVRMQDIAKYALQGKRPPNFNDQCAAFIASDIKNAIHEGIDRQEIVAGLVYSICMNYTNRVKGNRPSGHRIFMQGGVCYNRAVPMAMAALVGKPIVVPPEPGLMGAFGVALEVKKRLKAGLMTPTAFDLEALKNRQAAYGKRFLCRAGGNGCDRHCEIAMVRIDGKNIPFGGACNRYYNMHKRIRVDVEALDLVKKRQDIYLNVENTPANRQPPSATRPTVGINRSFLIHTYYPLYATFFECLGFDVRVPDTPSRRGIAERGAEFCYPAELSHGFFHRLVDSEHPPDYLFLPHVKSVPSERIGNHSVLCPLVQGEPYFLRTTFRRHLKRAGVAADRVLSPVLDLASGLAAARSPLLETAHKMDVSRRLAADAFDRAIVVQNRCTDRINQMGRQALQNLAADPRRLAAVIFGRPYNACASEAHMGIPRKLASRGVLVLPLDCLPTATWPDKRHMYWGMGQRIIRAARLVADHPQLFGVYITNFSCGPDSFIINYFRDIMGQKPSLTLELDSHTADAGLETRIEAFLDVVNAWRHLQSPQQPKPTPQSFTPARTEFKTGVPGVRTSSGRWLPLTDPRVTLLFPSMGKRSCESMAAVFESEGIHSVAAKPADEAVLKQGRANTTCKECLPLILTTGTLLNHLNRNRRPGEVLVYFMATGAGPCRFGQYRVFMEDLIKKRTIENVALFSLNSEDGYSGLDSRFYYKGWQSIIIADVMEDIRAMLLANAADPKSALVHFEKEWDLLIQAIKVGRPGDVECQLDRAAGKLRGIELKRPVETVPVINLVGEIFVRHDGISRQHLVERLAQRGFACVCAPTAEWMHYTDWLVTQGLICNAHMTWREKMGFALKRRAMRKTEARIKKKLARSGLIHTDIVDIPETIRHAHPYLTSDHIGEAILTVGSALKEVVANACGVIAIGPFGCMPNRVAESILKEAMTAADKLKAAPDDHRLRETLAGFGDLPFLAIESDGSPFPQIINAKLEAFCLHARRLHERIRAVRETDGAIDVDTRKNTREP